MNVSGGQSWRCGDIIKIKNRYSMQGMLFRKYCFGVSIFYVGELYLCHSLSYV